MGYMSYMSSARYQDVSRMWVRPVRFGVLLTVGLLSAWGSAQMPNERPLFVQPAQLQVGVYLMLSDSQLILPGTSGEGMIALTMAPNVSALSVQGLPAGVAADFAGSQLKITTSGAMAGEYALRVIAEWGKQTRQSELLLKIQEPAATTQWANIETAPVLVPSSALPEPALTEHVSTTPMSTIPVSPETAPLVPVSPDSISPNALTQETSSPMEAASMAPMNTLINTSVSAAPANVASGNIASGNTATTTFKVNPLTLWGGMGATTSGSSLRVGVSHSLGLVSLRGSADLGLSRTGLGADVLLNTPSSFYVGAGLSVVNKNATLGGLIGFRSELGSRLGYYLEGRGNWSGGGVFSAKNWSPALNVGVTFRF